MCGQVQTVIVRDPRARIVGGSAVRVNQYPWQAALLEKEKNSNTPYCGATLISDRWVITAAHCTERLLGFAYLITKTKNNYVPYSCRKKPNAISVVLGEHDHTTSEESVQLKMDVKK